MRGEPESDESESDKPEPDKPESDKPESDKPVTAERPSGDPERHAPELAAAPAAKPTTPAPLVLFAVVMLGLGFGYLFANLWDGDSTWQADAAWLGAAAGIIVGLACLLWAVAVRARKWVSHFLALGAWTFTVTTAVLLGMVDILTHGKLAAPSAAAGNAFLAMMLCWFGSWLLGRMELHRLQREMRTSGASAVDQRLTALEGDRRRADAQLTALDARLEQAAEHEASVQELLARVDDLSAHVEALRAGQLPPERRARLWRRDR